MSLLHEIMVDRLENVIGELLDIRTEGNDVHEHWMETLKACRDWFDNEINRTD